MASFIIRIYFAVVSAVTLFTLMFGAIDLLTIGLRQIVPGANVPEWGGEDCASAALQYIPGPTTEGVTGPTKEEQQRACEARNAYQLKSWQAQQASQTVRNISLIIISLPLFLLHFRVVYKDWKHEK